MKVLVTGGTGRVGWFVVEALLRAGHTVVVAGRSAPPPGFFSRPVSFVRMELAHAAQDGRLVEGVDALVHAAFDHLPERYRGGEGSDPDGFRRRNLDGSLALFEAARTAGVGRAVFVSSRAAVAADTLYGEVKRRTEEALSSLGSANFETASLRLTGVYGPAAPGRTHKWDSLFRAYLEGEPVAPRAGSEVHGDDAAAAVLLLLSCPLAPGDPPYGASDLMVDRRDLLAIVREVRGCSHPLPARAAASGIDVLSSERLAALGWRPGGLPLLERTVRDLVTKR